MKKPHHESYEKLECTIDKLALFALSVGMSVK